MNDNWYFAVNQQKIGPITLEELKAALSVRGDWKDVLVWRAGFPNWRKAEAVSEIIQTPPPIDTKSQDTATIEPKLAVGESDPELVLAGPKPSKKKKWSVGK